LIVENPKASGQLLAARFAHEDTNKACPFAWQRKSIANFYNAIKALRRESKEYPQTAKLNLLTFIAMCIGRSVLDLFFNVKQ
jgi:hypothetical protein